MRYLRDVVCEVCRVLHRWVPARLIVMGLSGGALACGASEPTPGDRPAGDPATPHGRESEPVDFEPGPGAGFEPEGGLACELDGQGFTVCYPVGVTTVAPPPPDGLDPVLVGAPVGGLVPWAGYGGVPPVGFGTPVWR